jgi:DNA modification methylase
MIELNKIYNEDCLIGLKRIQDNFVDFVITSPPYDGLREYNGYSFNFEEIVKELYRTIKVGGVVVWVVGDQTINGSESGTSFKQALFFKEIGFNLHDTMIYYSEKPPLTHNRYEQKFEYMFVFSKEKPKTFNPIMEDTINFGKISSGTIRNKGDELSQKNKIGEILEKKIKGNVWRYQTGTMSAENKVAFKHPAIFPENLVYDHLISWSNEKDVVLDPFMGSGTTAVVCVQNKRNYIGFEISKEYCELANKRLNDLPIYLF